MDVCRFFNSVGTLIRKLESQELYATAAPVMGALEHHVKLTGEKNDKYENRNKVEGFGLQSRTQKSRDLHAHRAACSQKSIHCSPAASCIDGNLILH